MYIDTYSHNPHTLFLGQGSLISLNSPGHSQARALPFYSQLNHPYHSLAIPTGLLPLLKKPSVHAIEEAGVTRCAQFLPLPSLLFPKPTRGLCMMWKCGGGGSQFLLQRHNFLHGRPFFFGKSMSSPSDATASRWHLITLRTRPRLLAMANRGDPVQPGPGYSNPHLTHTPTLQSMLFLFPCLLTISQDTPTPFLPQDLRTWWSHHQLSV